MELKDKSQIEDQCADLRMQVKDRIDNPDSSREELAALLRASTIIRSEATIVVGVMIIRRTEQGPRVSVELWNTPDRKLSEKDRLILSAMRNRMCEDEDYRAATEKFEKEFLGVNKDEY